MAAKIKQFSYCNGYKCETGGHIGIFLANLAGEEGFKFWMYPRTSQLSPKIKADVLSV